ncbi:ABC transporter family-like protein [Leishmania mexicana MHOM/GT/2001/U1103]|uniref:ABC transporter family-like protein n=1 Tax=Leishmania mexicana (strain MHOM/GT/2001/U1103) TaxID=929439 RepID=E9B4E5_LEIMU|nr:ABC transporter family-like protein [Leishmania mexicana MHOM/GT/2001/U1103]CBZ30113.1 ABC transporter family-like protein [Leishmania mexicana MHOM/GT/2001/U1103]
MAEVEACYADVDGQAAAVLARYMGWRAAKRVDTWWTAAVVAGVPSSQPPIASPASFSGIVPSFAFSNDIVLEEALELAYTADGVLRLAEDRRWLGRYVTILQYVLLRRVSQIEEAQLYRCLHERALFPCHPATHKRKGAVQGDRGMQRSTWAAAWRIHHRPTWLAPISGGARFLCLPLSYFPVEAVLPYVARETWLSNRLLSTMLPRWERLCVRSLRRTHKPAPPVPTLKNGARAEKMSSKVQYWFLRYTVPILRTCVEQQRAAARRFCMQELSTASGYDNAASSDLPRGSLALLWRCLRSTCTYFPSATSAAFTSEASAVPNKETSRLVRRVLILRALSQAVTVILQVCCPRLSIRYVTELMVAGYCSHGERSSPSSKPTTTTDTATASPVDTVLGSMAADMGWALVAGIVEALLTRFTGITGHQLSVLLADAATRRVEQELLCVDEAFYCRWLRTASGEADGIGATGVAASPGRRMSPVGMLPARPLITADDVLAVGRRGGERILALHDAVVKRSLRYAALIARAAVTREWRPLAGAAVTAWVDAPALLSSFSVAVGYSAPSDVMRLLSRREESLPSRSPVGLRLLLEVLVDEESDTTAPSDTRHRRRRRLRNPYLALVACSNVWTFEHLLADTKRTVASLCAHVCQLKAVYAAVAVYRYEVSSVRHATTAADVIAAMQEDVRCVLYYSVYQMEHTCRKRCGGVVAASPLLHPLLDPEETALLQQSSALSYLPAHVDYFSLLSLPYRFVLRQLGLEMVFAYRTAAGMQQESRQMAEEWWAQALFNSTFNPLTSALHEALQLTASCATVLLLCSQFVDGMWVVCPLPLPVLLRQAHAVQSYRDLLRSGVAVHRLEDGVAPLQQLCENLPHGIVSDAATLLRSSLQAKSSSAAPLSALQRRRRHWRQVLTASRPELCFDADDRIVGGLRLRGGVSWHHVYFTYPQLFVAPNAEDTEQGSASDTCGVRPTLADACFACPAVGMTAVVGPSGAGKSSLNLLLRRLYDPVAVVEFAQDGGTARSPPDEQLGAYVDLNHVGTTADAEDVLVEVLRLALVESALPPPSNNVRPHSPSLLSAADGQRVTSQPSPTASASAVTSPRYRLRVQPGYIALDGIPLSLFAAAYVRQWLGWLRQTPHVQPRQSFLSNVRGTAMHVTVCDVQRALRVCGCDAFVEEKQRTLRDPVGHLSGGEAQRLALASVVAVLLARSRVELLHGMPLHDSDARRAAAAAAAVGGLVLDEPTSNLDAANEHQLLAALEALQEGSCEANSEAGTGLPLFIWMISHRMSSLRSAQHMVVVEDGRVTASGPSAEVKESNLFAKTQLQLQQLTDVSTSARADTAT